jgi:hypothetical protein
MAEPKGGWRRNDPKVGRVNQGDLFAQETVFMQPKSRADRSQSLHSSCEVP